ncbi:MAG: segregation and condensation protein A [Acutalibacteraceae bacterium]
MEKIQYKLDVFEGPMDLLLYLISKHKLNINDIPIFELVEQYIDYVRQMQEADMEIASEFVEMAARLVYIKTVSLLPVHEEAEQLRKELSGELIEYRDCKLIAEQLSKQTEGFDYFEREPMVIEADMRYKRIHDPVELIRHYIDAVGRGKNKLPPPIEAFGAIVAKKIVSVNSRIVFVYRKLLKKSKVRFAEFFENSSSVSEMVATFLAVLELVKANKIHVNGEKESCTVSFESKG